MEAKTGIIELSDQEIVGVNGGIVLSTAIAAVALGIYIGSRIWP